MKTLREFLEEAEQLNVVEHAADGDPDIELKPHENGTHYVVHKVSAKSGIEPDQLKTGEKLNDTHVDDLKDMGYKVKIHST